MQTNARMAQLEEANTVTVSNFEHTEWRHGISFSAILASSVAALWWARSSHGGPSF
jgi:hypothetical protein